MYDIIGDIHGYADELHELLERLGYERRSGVYQHPERKMVFVGDFIDRGPQIREVLETVKSMCDADHALAVMGNHEFNALAFHTAHPSEAGNFLRPHHEKNLHQHSATLKQLTDDQISEYLDWFRKLPMWLDLDAIRVVHACWDDALQSTVETYFDRHGGLTDEFLYEATERGSELFRAVEGVLKGKEAFLPNGFVATDKEGNKRRTLRVRWFDSSAGHTYSSYAMIADNRLPNHPLPESIHQSNRPYPTDACPVFFGHYWYRADRPQPVRNNVACLDYSVAKGGMLCAYRWQGESRLLADNYETVTSRTAL